MCPHFSSPSSAIVFTTTIKSMPGPNHDVKFSVVSQATLTTITFLWATSYVLGAHRTCLQWDILPTTDIDIRTFNEARAVAVSFRRFPPPTPIGSLSTDSWAPVQHFRARGAVWSWTHGERCAPDLLTSLRLLLQYVIIELFREGACTGNFISVNLGVENGAHASWAVFSDDAIFYY